MKRETFEKSSKRIFLSRFGKKRPSTLSRLNQILFQIVIDALGIDGFIHIC